MFLPYRTDAPVYHRPYATVGLIVVNTVILVLCMMGSVEVESLVLPWGSIDPLRWITSICAHAGPVHLIGNMVVLWTFGLVVEGKVGAWRFLAIYFGLGVAQCVIEQILMIHAGEGGSLGASGVIFGLMGMGMIWAPKNNVDVAFLFGGYLYARGGSFTMSIRGAVYLILGIQFVYQLLSSSMGQHVTSMSLHLLGAATGVALAVLLLQRGQVDCEGWDWFSVRDRAV